MDVLEFLTAKRNCATTSLPPNNTVGYVAHVSYMPNVSNVSLAQTVGLGVEQADKNQVQKQTTKAGVKVRIRVATFFKLYEQS